MSFSNEIVRDYARQIAGQIIMAARNSGTDPIAWVTGNSYMPPLRSFSLAETIWQATADEEYTWDFLVETVEDYLADANVALECPDHDNALYAVDLARFEYTESELGENLQDGWRPITSAESIREVDTGTYDSSRFDEPPRHMQREL